MIPQELPEKYYDLYERNVINGLFSSYEGRAPEEIETVDCFSWSNTPEGHLFWAQVEEAKTIKELPRIPSMLIEHKNLKRNTTRRQIVCKDKDGRTYNVSCMVSGMTNCGMGSMHHFGFHVTNPSREHLFMFDQFVSQQTDYPYFLATHNEKFEGWFKSWDKIDEFRNPNSGNMIGIYKIKTGFHPAHHEEFMVKHEDKLHITKKREKDEKTTTDTPTPVSDTDK